jgi:hypothetical protein
MENSHPLRRGCFNKGGIDRAIKTCPGRAALHELNGEHGLWRGLLSCKQCIRPKGFLPPPHRNMIEEYDGRIRWRDMMQEYDGGI